MKSETKHICWKPSELKDYLNTQNRGMWWLPDMVKDNDENSLNHISDKEISKAIERHKQDSGYYFIPLPIVKEQREIIEKIKELGL